MRVLVLLVTAALVGLVTLVPGASAQTGFTGFEASSTGLISEEGFVNLGTTFECATATYSRSNGPSCQRAPIGITRSGSSPTSPASSSLFSISAAVKGVQ